MKTFTSRSTPTAESPRSLIISVSIVGSPGRCPPLASSDCNDDHSSQVGNAVTFRLSVRHASRFVHGQSIRHDPPTTGVEKKSLWSSSFHCTRAFLAVNEKRGRSEGLGPPTSAKALVRRLCVGRLAQSSAVARLQSARTKHNSRSELSLFLKRSLDLFQASH